MLLVDSNVLLDIVTDDPIWGRWSASRLDEERRKGPILIDGVVYAEIAVRYAKPEEVEELLRRAGVDIAPTPRAALFRAAKAFEGYRANGGKRTSVIPDFFIGAHAAAHDWPLLTRDPRPHRTYFPEVRLIAPPAHP